MATSPNVADAVWFVAGSTGTADFADGTGLTGSTNLAGGATNGKEYSYRAEDPIDKSIWEYGHGVYNSAAGGTLGRTVVKSSAGGTTKVNFATAPVVMLTPMKYDWDAVIAALTPITAQSTTAHVVGRQGTTNPAWQVDTNAASSVTGAKITALAAGAGVDLQAASSATDEDLRINSKAAGILGLQTASAGPVVVGHTASLATGGAARKMQVWGAAAAAASLALGMFNATAGTAASLDFYRSKNAAIASATVVASGDVLGSINWYGAQQTGTFATQNTAAQIRAEVDTAVTSGASADMPGRIVFATTADGSGTLTDRLILDSAGVLKPAANDGVALGTTALMFSDLFLASGAVINFNNGDVTLTHSTNLLAFAGASSGYTFDAVLTPATNDAAALGTSSLMFSDLFLASGGVINWNNGDVLATHSANTLAFTGASSGYTFDAGLTVTAASSNAIVIRSGSSSAWAGLQIGRTAAECGILIDEGTNHWQTGSVAGDVTIYNSAGAIFFGSANALASWMKIAGDGSVTIGAPTGGDKGAGTINAAGSIYVNNSALTCFGIEFLVDGKIDLQKWDGYAASGRHDIAHEFAGMVEAGFDPRDPAQFIDHMKRNRALPGMPSQATWRPADHSLDELQMRSWLSTELLASAFAGHVDQTERRLAALERRD